MEIPDFDTAALRVEAQNLWELVTAAETEAHYPDAIKGLSYYDKTQYWLERFYGAWLEQDLYVHGQVLLRMVLALGEDSGHHERRQPRREDGQPWNSKEPGLVWWPQEHLPIQVPIKVDPDHIGIMSRYAEVTVNPAFFAKITL